MEKAYRRPTIRRAIEEWRGSQSSSLLTRQQLGNEIGDEYAFGLFMNPQFRSTLQAAIESELREMLPSAAAIAHSSSFPAAERHRARQAAADRLPPSLPSTPETTPYRPPDHGHSSSDRHTPPRPASALSLINPSEHDPLSPTHPPPPASDEPAADGGIHERRYSIVQFIAARREHQERLVAGTPERTDAVPHPPDEPSRPHHVLVLARVRPESDAAASPAPRGDNGAGNTDQPGQAAEAEEEQTRSREAPAPAAAAAAASSE
mmetsp:Transcript_18985/g.54416  ORF Transcript_18985/g.54416 Transcript_18985/m.54416 type:complete len:263 (-) Transcript_18985:1255-2043(-)